MKNVAMIGFGGIAQSHKNAHLRLEAEGKERLVAVCDITPSSFEKRIKINIDTGEQSVEGSFNTYTDLEKMLASEEIDVIDICIPSYLHADLAIDMMERGYDVMSEKPMALHHEDCLRMLDAMRRTGKVLMIGQVLHFYPEYACLKRIVSDGRFGKPTSAVFQRFSGLPKWSWENWYHDYDKAGGVISDMLIHDIDMARYLFGTPAFVECNASSKNVKYDCAHIAMGYDFPVTCIGDWSQNGARFKMAYWLGFEKATVILEKGKPTVYPNDGGEPYVPAEYEGGDGMYYQLKYMLELVETGKKNEISTPEGAAETIRIVEAAHRSADMRGERVAL